MKQVVFFLLATSLIIIGCNSGNSGFKTSKNGLKYKIVAGSGKDSLLKKGDVVAFALVQKMEDSLVFNSYEGGHKIEQVDTTEMPFDIRFIFKYLKVGDSAMVRISADSIYNSEKRKAQQAPNFSIADFNKNVPAFFLKKGNYINIGVKILDKFTMDSTKANFAKDTARYASFMKEQQAKGMAYSQKMQEKEMAEAKKKAEVNKKVGDKFLSENKTKAGITTTASGIQYQLIKAGTGAKPTPTDNVKVHYIGTTLDGKEFDNSVKRGEPAQFNVGGVVKGWTEMLQLMPVGSKYKVWIPSDLGYGDTGNGPSIAPGETLVFEMELIDIVKEQPKVAMPPQGKPMPTSPNK